MVGKLARPADGTIRGGGELPQGCVGAAVFISVPQGGDSFKLVCVGGALPPDGHGFRHHPVATFDAIRRALNSLPEETSAPPRKRRWWQQRI